MADGLHLTKTHAEMCLDVRFPSQTQARLRCDHAECVTKMPKSEWHLSPELKRLDSASINTKIVFHMLKWMHAHWLLALAQRLPETRIVWCLKHCALQSRQLSFLQSRFEAITVHRFKEQILWSRWFTDGEDRRSTVLWIHRRTRLASDRTWHKSLPVNQILMGLVDLGRSGFTLVSCTRL